MLLMLHSTLPWSVLVLFTMRMVSGLSNGGDEHQESDNIDSDNRDTENQTTVRDENHPLLTVMETKPHSMSLMVKPRDYRPDTMVRLLYERVPLHRKPMLQHLDDPVIEYIHLIRRVQSHDLTELPMGKYIVCGEAMVHGEVYQASCFETRIERLDNNTLQSGVKVIIIISIVMVVLVIVYAVLYQLCKKTVCRTNK
eukprot:GFUD01078870.1.p1 GENE.GFUD01078870.1~~GFUD01078870.1.p1  ORF type:complete len:197 (+),score=67.73 GFUD01078870.1:73-663(+)